MAEHNSTAKPTKGKSQAQAGLWRVVRNFLVVCGVLAVLITPMLIADSCSGQSSSGEGEEQESQLFVTHPFELQSGLAIVEMSHQGEKDFVVNLLPMEQEGPTTPERIEFFGDQNGGSYTQPALALAEQKGSANISRAVNIPSAGERVFDVKASGPWTIQVEQPHPSSAPRPTRFSGDDDTATPFFQLSRGSKKVTVTNPLRGTLKISLLDSDGNEVKRFLEDKTEQNDEDQSNTVEETVEIPSDGIYLFDVQADSLWTIDIDDAE
jgi:hypothetical protein